MKVNGFMEDMKFKEPKGEIKAKNVLESRAMSQYLLEGVKSAYIWHLTSGSLHQLGLSELRSVRRTVKLWHGP